MKPQTLPRLAGLAYLGIIASGLTAELAFRGPVVGATDPTLALQSALPDWRAAIGLDLVMLTLDAALAFILFYLFRPHGPNLSLAALALRLTQMAIIAAHLPLLVSAIDAPDASALMTRHGIGYDVGLWFFGLNALVMATLLWRVGARMLGGLVASAGGVYLIGTLTRLVAPELNAAFQPAYGIAVIAELSFALWLLRGPRALRTAA
ncbi:DUF4386 domain-containing protein [Pseudooceanicola sp. MF1-13]|uniref:DUF4386 domain-containing protein n=1 Tax=Pseudooceanicola sp. MF1-13 TaxID=3379095 RepID=UPI00389225D2